MTSSAYLPGVSWGGASAAPQAGTSSSTSMLYLPGVKWTTTPVVSRDVLNGSAVSASEQQLSVAAENAPLRIIYGQPRIGPQIACVLGYGGSLVILAVWGHGEVDSFVDLQIDDLPVAAGVTVTHYTGTAGQTVNAALVAAFAAQSPPISYTDALPGICYSVVTVPAGASSGFPRITAKIKGLKVYDPRLDSTAGGSGTQRLATPSTWAWSDNPALCTANFAANSVYGMGKTVDWASVASVAADNDVLAGGTEKMRTLNLALETVQLAQAWLDTLRTYASCWTMPSAADLKFVSDKAGSSVATYSHASGNIMSLTALKKRGVQAIPTVLTVTYTDTSTVPHRDGTAVVYAAGVLAGTTPRRESQVSLPGINRYSQAFREATERLNKFLLNDLSLTLGVFDEALVIEAGDIVTVTHPVGLTDKLMRVMGISGDYGRYSLTLVEYDPAVYDASVATAPTYADTSLPNPTAPPAVSGVTMVEEVFQQQNGTWASRWRITWSAATYPYLSHYRAELWAGSDLIHTGKPDIEEWPTPAVQEGVSYTAKIGAVSSIGSVGAWGTQSGVCAGKTLIPGDVPSVSAFEAGGRVYVSWLPAVDIDIWRYEVRYGAVAGTWAAATLIDRVDALRLMSDQLPVGTWVLHVKALDSVQQYSTTAATTTVTVTSDSNSFLVDSLDQTNPALANMAEYSLARTDPNRYFVSEDGVAFGTKFSAALATYTDPLATYHASMTSTWMGEAEDFGLLLGGNWAGTADVINVGGTHQSYLGHSVDGSAWTYPAGLSQKVNARFARLKHEALTTATMLVTIPEQSIRIEAVPREETFSGTSSASNATTVFLSGDYVSVKKISISISGTTAASHTEDNVGRNAPNPADKAAQIIITGNAITKAGTNQWDTVRSKHPVPTAGKWYWEIKITAGGAIAALGVGLVQRASTLAGAFFNQAGCYGYAGHNAACWVNGSLSGTAPTFTTGDVIGVAYDATSGTLTFYKNNTSAASITGISGEKFIGLAEYYTDGNIESRLLSSQWSYTPPAGYLPLPYAFDEHIFNDAGARVARDFLGSFQGV